MRITSGKARGISLESPRGDATRPATDAARQAVFSSIGGIVEGARVLDLFAGTGAYGLEALSRGAAEVLFVESSRSALLPLRKNIVAVLKALSPEAPRAELLPQDVYKFKSAARFDLVFADPPYEQLRNPRSFSSLLSLFEGLAGPETLFVLEAPAEIGLPAASPFEPLKRLGKKSKGKPTQIVFRLFMQI